jgi:hypothetical protein
MKRPRKRNCLSPSATQNALEKLTECSNNDKNLELYRRKFMNNNSCCQNCEYLAKWIKQNSPYFPTYMHAFGILYPNWWTFAQSGVDDMITILGDFCQFSAKKLRKNISKTNVMIKILHDLALFWVKNANFFAIFFGENILKNHNIDPRSHCSQPQIFINLPKAAYFMNILLLWDRAAMHRGHIFSSTFL